MASSLEQKFFEYCRINEEAEVRKVLPKVSVNWRNPQLFSYTGLHIACICGHTGLTSLLLKHPSISVNQLDLNGSSPFLLACMAGRTEIVKVLLQDARVDVNLDDKWRVSPLWWAANNGHCEVVKWIIASGRAHECLEDAREAFGSRDRNLLTAIEIARGNGRQQLVELLLRFKRDPASLQKELAIQLGYLGMLSPFFFFFCLFACLLACLFVCLFVALMPCCSRRHAGGEPICPGRVPQ